jgi:hypothetical protein
LNHGTDIALVSRQQLRLPADQVNATTETAKHLGPLALHRPGTENRQADRQLLQLQEFRADQATGFLGPGNRCWTQPDWRDNHGTAEPQHLPPHCGAVAPSEPDIAQVEVNPCDGQLIERPSPDRTVTQFERPPEQFAEGGQKGTSIGRTRQPRGSPRAGQPGSLPEHLLGRPDRGSRGLLAALGKQQSHPRS